MNNTISTWFQNLQASDLQPIVGQVLDRPNVEVLEWQIQAISGGSAEYTNRGFGVYRVTGTARDDSGETPWSAIIKVLGPSDEPANNEPGHHGYWKREVLAFQAGILEQLPGNLVAPRCYAIQEMSDDKHCIWLEAVDESERHWTMAQHQLAARHLGQFNGAYLAGHPLPGQTSWMLPGRTQQWLAELQMPDKEQLLLYSETKVNRWLSKESIARIMRLWAARQTLLAGLGRLPGCFCHHDAFRRNLMLRHSQSGGPCERSAMETVAIDWSYTGPGKVGQEIGVTTAIALQFMDVAANQARDLDEAIFTGYSAGLADAGWQGDLQLVRFGYTVTAALTFGVAFSVLIANGWHRAENFARAEAIVGHPIADIIEQYAVVHPFLLDLGDEALALLPSIEQIVA
jgi:hypothetical protein